MIRLKVSIPERVLEALKRGALSLRHLFPSFVSIPERVLEALKLSTLVRFLAL